MNENINTLLSCLSDDLLHDKHKKNRNNYLSGHCYIVTEAIYYLLDDEDRKDYVPSTLKINNVTHWFLKNKKTNEVIDATKEQFNFNLNYDVSRNRFFLTNKPSKRTLILLNRFYEKNNN